MTRVALFGAGGQLGSELIAQASRHAVALQAYAHRDIDIADLPGVERALASAQADVVVNAAAYSDVDRAETERDAAFRTNATGAAMLGRASAAMGLPIVHISTDYVFDGSKAEAYQEDDPIAPLNVYGASKAVGEASLRHENSQHVILRTSWLYGIYGRNFLRTMIGLAAKKNTIAVVTDQLGCPTSTADLAAAVLRLVALFKEDYVAWGTYHFSGTGAASRYEFAREIVAAASLYTGRHPTVTPIISGEIPGTARRPPNSELDCSRFATTFGFRAMPWQDQTRKAVAMLFGHQEGLG
jgi:dTDP-4-dehydrorhamnose reductase